MEPLYEGSNSAGRLGGFVHQGRGTGSSFGAVHVISTQWKTFFFLHEFSTKFAQICFFSSIVLSLRASCSLQEKADLVLEIEMRVMESLRILQVISLEKKRIVSWGNKSISRLQCTETPERWQGDF